VSIVGQDGQTYSRDVTASSQFDAADQVVQGWSKLWWWYGPNAVIEIRVAINAGRSGPAGCWSGRPPGGQGSSSARRKPFLLKKRRKPPTPQEPSRIAACGHAGSIAGRWVVVRGGDFSQGP
jgi:hypothetical protein